MLDFFRRARQSDAGKDGSERRETFAECREMRGKMKMRKGWRKREDREKSKFGAVLHIRSEDLAEAGKKLRSVLCRSTDWRRVNSKPNMTIKRKEKIRSGTHKRKEECQKLEAEFLKIAILQWMSNGNEVPHLRFQCLLVNQQIPKVFCSQNTLSKDSQGLFRASRLSKWFKGIQRAQSCHSHLRYSHLFPICFAAKHNKLHSSDESSFKDTESFLEAAQSNISTCKGGRSITTCLIVYHLDRSSRMLTSWVYLWVSWKMARFHLLLKCFLFFSSVAFPFCSWPHQFCPLHLFIPYFKLDSRVYLTQTFLKRNLHCSSQPHYNYEVNFGSPWIALLTSYWHLTDSGQVHYLSLSLLSYRWKKNGKRTILFAQG